MSVFQVKTPIIYADGTQHRHDKPLAGRYRRRSAKTCRRCQMGAPVVNFAD